MPSDNEVREAVKYFREIYEGAENKELDILISLGEAYLSAGTVVEKKGYGKDWTARSVAEVDGWNKCVDAHNSCCTTKFIR